MEVIADIEKDGETWREGAPFQKKSYSQELIREKKTLKTKAYVCEENTMYHFHKMCSF